MAYNFHPMSRKQKYLLPPNLEDWLAEGVSRIRKFSESGTKPAVILRRPIAA
jgi:hypothetical protein